MDLIKICKKAKRSATLNKQKIQTMSQKMMAILKIQNTRLVQAIKRITVIQIIKNKEKYNRNLIKN